MGKRKKTRSGATPEEMLRLLAKAEEQIAKKTQGEIESENNNPVNNYVTNYNEVKDIPSTAVKDKIKTDDKNEAKTKDKTEAKTNNKTKEKADSKPAKKAKEKSSKNIMRGATPEEMLKLIAKAEERITKEGREELSLGNITASETEQFHTTEIKDLVGSDSSPEETEKSQVRTYRYLPGSKYIKTKAAVFMVLATLSATALTFGLSLVNFPSEIIRGALTIKKPAQILTIDFTANETDINAGNETDLNADYEIYTGKVNETGLNSDYETVTDAGNETDSDTGNETAMNHNTLELSPVQPREVSLSVVKSHNQSNKDISSIESDVKLVESSDNNRWEISNGSYTSFDFSDISVPTDAQIKSVVVYIEHFEEEQCIQGNLEWSIGTGRPGNPIVWASIKAPVKNGILEEAVDSWDITSLTDSNEKLNSLQLHVENNNNVAGSKTLINYINVLVRWD
jgi:hypothetical protein